MVPLPQPRPSRIDLAFVRPRPVVSVAIAIAELDIGYRFFAAGGGRRWSGTTTAPNAEIAVLDAIEQILTDKPENERIRFVVNLPGASPLWRNGHALAAAAPGVWIERPTHSDRLLIEAAAAGLPRTPPPEPTAPSPRVNHAPVIVATDGSVRRKHAGFGWLCSSGDYGLAGYRSSSKRVGAEPVLVAELHAIGDAVCKLPARHLTVVSDSQDAVEMANAWKRGERILPAGYPVETTVGESSLLITQRRIHLDRHRIDLRWAPGHRGEPLNEGADTLARLGSRYIRGDQDLNADEYRRRAVGIAQAFSAEFRRLDRLSA